MINDTISDMLTRIRNANLTKHQIVQVPDTTLTSSLTQILLNEKLILSFKKLKNGCKNYLLLCLKYENKDLAPRIKQIKRISTPGLRIYTSYKKMPKILDGFGIFIISTSKGLVTDAQARKEKIGGEILCFIR